MIFLLDRCQQERLEVADEALDLFLSHRPAAAGSISVVRATPPSFVDEKLSAFVGPVNSEFGTLCAARCVPVFDPERELGRAYATQLNAAIHRMGWRIGAVRLMEGKTDGMLTQDAAGMLADALSALSLGASDEEEKPLADIWIGCGLGLLEQLAEWREKCTEERRLILFGGVSAEEVVQALTKLGLPPSHHRIFISELTAAPKGAAGEAIALHSSRRYDCLPTPCHWAILAALEAAADQCKIAPAMNGLMSTAPLQLMLCNGDGLSRVMHNIQEYRAPLERDFSAVLAARRFVLRSSGLTDDYGRAAAARWALNYTGEPSEGVVVAEPERMVRIYRPEGFCRGKLIYIHGGGMVYYDLDVFHSFMSRLAAGSGLEITALGYDKLPETPAEQAIDNLMDRLSHQVGQDNNYIIAGDSIGGFLALFAAVRIVPQRVKQLVLIYPVLSLNEYYASFEKFGNGFLLDAGTMLWFRSMISTYFRVRGFDPMELSAESLAGMRIDVISAGCDVLADEGEHFCIRHPNVQHIRCASLPHDFCLYTGKLASARTGLEQVLATMIQPQEKEAL